LSRINLVLDIKFKYYWEVRLWWRWLWWWWG